MFKKVLVLFVFVFLLMPVTAVFGSSHCGDILQGQPPCSELGNLDTTSRVGQSGGVDSSRLVGSIINLVNWFSWFVGLAAVVMGLYSGFLFITARDNASQLATARNTMMYAIIGIGVAIVAFSLVTISKAFLGV